MKLKLFSIIILFLFTPFIPSAKAVGLSPPIINAENVSKNTPYKVTIKLFNDQKTRDQDLYLDVTPYGEYSHYLEAEKTATIPANQSPVEYSFFINAKNAAVGNYEMMLTFTTRSSNPNEDKSKNDKNKISNQVSIVQGASLIIRFNVSGEEKIEFTLLSAQLLNTETTLPLYINYTLKNSGNVDWKPSKIVTVMSDINDTSKKQEITVPADKIPLISPGETQENKIELKHSLPTGNYEATLQFFDKSQNNIGELESTTFNILPPNTLKQSGDLIDLNTVKTKYKPNEKIKINALFENTGNIPVSGFLITEIYSNEELLDILKSSELMVNAGQQSHFSQIIDLQNTGNYKISAYVEFGNKKSGVRSKNIQIIGKELSQKETITFLIIIALVLGVIAVLYKQYQHHREKKHLDSDE